MTDQPEDGEPIGYDTTPYMRAWLLFMSGQPIPPELLPAWEAGCDVAIAQALRATNGLN